MAGERTLTRLGAAVAATMAAYFAFVVPTDLAVLLVGSAAGIAVASFTPVFAVVGVTRLVE